MPELRDLGAIAGDSARDGLDDHRRRDLGLGIVEPREMLRPPFGSLPATRLVGDERDDREFRHELREMERRRVRADQAVGRLEETEEIVEPLGADVRDVDDLRSWETLLDEAPEFVTGAERRRDSGERAEDERPSLLLELRDQVALTLRIPLIEDLVDGEAIPGNRRARQAPGVADEARAFRRELEPDPVDGRVDQLDVRMDPARGREGLEAILPGTAPDHRLEPGAAVQERPEFDAGHEDRLLARPMSVSAEDGKDVDDVAVATERNVETPECSRHRFTPGTPKRIWRDCRQRTTGASRRDSGPRGRYLGTRRRRPGLA